MRALILIIAIVILSACGGDNIPKPKGYFRIDLPEKKYKLFQSDCDYSFRHPVYSSVENYRGGIPQKCWYDLQFPEFRATIHLSYYSLNGDLNKHLEDSRSLAYKHSVKANSIDEVLISNPAKNVYGLVYEIRGNAASSVQFYLTDSTNNFVRGALYFNASPNFDSIAPVHDFLRTDIDTLIQSFSWSRERRSESTGSRK